MDEPREVEVEVDGQWWPGFLHQWRRDPDGWRAYVTWRTAPGFNHLGWTSAERVRPVA